MTFQILIGVAVVFWLIGVGAGLLAIRRSFLPVPNRFWPSLVMSLVALVIGYLGLTRIHLNYSETVNGRVKWHFESNWFFIVLLVLGALALACALWKNRKSPVAN